MILVYLGLFPLILTVLYRDSSTPPPHYNPYEGLLGKGEHPNLYSIRGNLAYPWVDRSGVRSRATTDMIGYDLT